LDTGIDWDGMTAAESERLMIDLIVEQQRSFAEQRRLLREYLEWSDRMEVTTRQELAELRREVSASNARMAKLLARRDGFARSEWSAPVSTLIRVAWAAWYESRALRSSEPAEIEVATLSAA
jgi:hypothetical protein